MTAQRPVPMPSAQIEWIDARGHALWAEAPASAAGDTAISMLAILTDDTPLIGPSGAVAAGQVGAGRILTGPDGPRRVIWSGRRPLATGETLWRVRAGAFGPGRPQSDVVLGRAAFLRLSDPRLQPLIGGTTAYAPVAALADGVRIAAVRPPRPPGLVALATGDQAPIAVLGLDVAPWHPAQTGASGRGLAHLVPPLDCAAFATARIPYLTNAEAAGLREPWPRTPPSMLG
ncbi:hypothetical protein [Jannaschia sp. LMIT008]|uniref:hypothetical protein n=1 Tax=Jannaschia maritima TaxID=3032585 RepID=UPI002810E35D|nr:hypothetical protein [Jannaschia sp. LMIT008]